MDRITEMLTWGWGGVKKLKKRADVFYENWRKISWKQRDMKLEMLRHNLFQPIMQQPAGESIEVFA